VGAKCSRLVCYAANVGDCNTNTESLDDDAFGVLIPWDNVRDATYLVKANAHTVLVKTRNGPQVTVIEQTGRYPVGREAVKAISDYEDDEEDGEYHPRDFVDVANAQGSDGVLLAWVAGDQVELTWMVETANDARWYEFQYWDAARATWWTISQQDYRGVGDYRASGPFRSPLTVYRVLEVDWMGCKIAHGETVAAFAARADEGGEELRTAAGR
jgi:hypothetical protein